jgi:hypothetical protein
MQGSNPVALGSLEFLTSSFVSASLPSLSGTLGKGDVVVDASRKQARYGQVLPFSHIRDHEDSVPGGLKTGELKAFGLRTCHYRPLFIAKGLFRSSSEVPGMAEICHQQRYETAAVPQNYMSESAAIENARVGFDHLHVVRELR